MSSKPTEPSGQAGHDPIAAYGLFRAVVFFASLAGAAGVALAATAAHRVDSVSLATAAMMLMVHAGAAIAIAAAAQSVATPARLLVCAMLILIGVSLFAGAIALTVLAELSLPPIAPIGGTTLIAAWVITALVALLSPRRLDK